MQDIREYFKQFSQKQIIALAGALVLILVLVLCFIIFTSNVRMSILYGDLDIEDSGKIIQELEHKNIPYELVANGSIIKIPEHLVLLTRVTLAKDGLPNKGSVIGYEIFDQEETLGTTNFLQNIKLVRALEGELKRSIEAFDTVEKARLHLVIPQKEIFSKDKLSPKASIMLTLKRRSSLSKHETESIASLVGSAIPNLELNNITIIDSQGNALKLAGKEEASGGNATNDERKLALEGRIKKVIEDLLEKSLGIGKVKAEVTADMNFDRVVTTSEIYDPDGVVARSSQVIEDREKNASSSSDVDLSVTNNIPGGSPEDSSDSGTLLEKIDETTNYEISKTIKNHIYENGVLKKLSVAVLVDGYYQQDSEGKNVYIARSEEEIAKITSLVKTAIGYDSKRNDNVEVYNMKFSSNIRAIEDIADESFIKEHLPFASKSLIIFVISIILLHYYFKPFVKKMSAMRNVAIAEQNKQNEDNNRMNSAKLNDIIKSNIKDSLIVLQRWMNKV